MLFGFRRVPGWAHTGATFLVAFGTTVSAFWIIVLNSWMHTPQGFEMRDGVAFATDWAAIVFNPSMPYRLTHMLLASGLTVAFLIAGVSALRWLMGDRGAAMRKAFATGITLGAVLIPAQIYMGDMHGLNTLEHQPAKVAAMEGNWETGPNTPLLLFAIPDEEARENRFEIGIPSLASIILTHHADGVVPGLNDFVEEDGTPMHPPVAKVFWSFRIMVGTGVAMLGLSWLTLALMRKRGMDGLPMPLMLALVPMALSGWVATLAGWYTTEIGRQPWLVQGVLTTEAAVGDVAGGAVASSLVLYLVVYAVLMIAYLGTILHLARKASGAGSLPPARGPFPLPAE
jgi:cytochrome d ubiquinol oxidase subunit I